MATPANSSAPESALYRRVWRWHFYAGLVCMPFLALLALTGSLYLFKDAIEDRVYADLRFVQTRVAAPLDAQALVDKALAAQTGQAVRFKAATVSGTSAEVGVRTASGTVAVYLDPADGRVLGVLRDDRRLSEVVKRLHSLELVGSFANYWVEVVAGWAIVLVASGLFLWWPRGQKGGVLSVRGTPARRIWWRDLHAVTGVIAAAAIVFLAVTGLPWSAYWGKHFGRITAEMGVGLPRYLFGPGPASTPPSAPVGGTLPWVIAQAPVPQSPDPQAAHSGHGAHAPPQVANAPMAHEAASIGLNEALQRFDALGVPRGTSVSLPSGAQGTYAAMHFPNDVRSQRVVHLNRYSGAVLSDMGYRDYGAAGKAIEWGVNLHTGLQFGLLNQLVMLVACLSIIGLAVSCLVMWWKRRPKGRLAAPPRRAGDRAAWSALAVAAALGLIYPLLGASMLLALLIDALVPRRWQERYQL